MVWGAIWTAGHSELVVCDSNVNAEKYISILDQGFVRSVPASCLELTAASPSILTSRCTNY